MDTARVAVVVTPRGRARGSSAPSFIFSQWFGASAEVTVRRNGRHKIRTLTGAGGAAVHIAGREGFETTGHAFAVGLAGLDGGSGGDDGSNSVGELHGELGNEEGGRKGLVVQEPESNERVGQKSDGWHEAEGAGRGLERLERWWTKVQEQETKPTARTKHDLYLGRGGASAG